MNNDDPKLGATGNFPRGKLNEDDEGELRLSVGRKDGTVCIEFGKPVHWFGMPPTEAVQLAKLLLHHAKKAAKENGEVLVIELSL